MAKKHARIPKKIAGLKIPKALRKSKLLGSLLSSPMGRQIVADALIAGAGAAATTLVRDREEVADAAKAGARTGRRSAHLLGDALQNAADAVMDVVADAARSLAPKQSKKRKHGGHDRPSDAVRH